MNQQDQEDAPRSLKPYTTPALSVFGELALLTKGSSGTYGEKNGHHLG
jgi:hypothetical protein